MQRTSRSQSGQAIVLVAVAMLALIGSAALVLVAGSATWQRDQLQTLADSTAIDSALKIGIGCNAASAAAVITEADNFLATQRPRTGALAIAAGTCATPYTGTDTFGGGLKASYLYPYRAHQQQVQVILTLTLPISFGGVVGKTTTTLTRYAVAQSLPGSMAAVSATTLRCTGGQVNVAGDIRVRNAITVAGGCAMYAHRSLAAGSNSSLANVAVYADGQRWVFGGGRCRAGLTAGSTNAICADGYELSGHLGPACAGAASQYLSAADLAVNANPCAAGVGRTPVAPLSPTTPPDPNTDASAIATLRGTAGLPCAAAAIYPRVMVNGRTVYSGLAPKPTRDANRYWHFVPSCYGYIDVGQLRPDRAVLDPGFYYFNGSNFGGGGGGICLNSNVLLARDVTLEFVNRAGFHSGNCTVGGGGNCAAPCAFGSAPCSLAACPPNAPADPPNRLTWFAAPCSTAPSALDAASCTGSAWCPVGDRACWNLLAWTPAAATGQLLLTGNAQRAWLLGTVYWAGGVTYRANGTSTIAGALSCGTLSISAAAGSAVAIGGDYGINIAPVEAVLVE